MSDFGIASCVKHRLLSEVKDDWLKYMISFIFIAFIWVYFWCRHWGVWAKRIMLAINLVEKWKLIPFRKLSCDVKAFTKLFSVFLVSFYFQVFRISYVLFSWRKEGGGQRNIINSCRDIIPFSFLIENIEKTHEFNSYFNFQNFIFESPESTLKFHCQVTFENFHSSFFILISEESSYLLRSCQPTPYE